MTSPQAELEKPDFSTLAEKLRGVPADSRKLLVRILEMAYGQNREGRQPDTAYLPELHESCGLDVEGMYEALQPLQQAGLIEVENQYPFEDVHLMPGDESGRTLLRMVCSVCQRKKISLRDVLVELRFDLLS